MRIFPYWVYFLFALLATGTLPFSMGWDNVVRPWALVPIFLLFWGSGAWMEWVSRRAMHQYNEKYGPEEDHPF